MFDRLFTVGSGSKTKSRANECLKMICYMAIVATGISSWGTLYYGI